MVTMHRKAFIIMIVLMS